MVERNECMDEMVQNPETSCVHVDMVINLDCILALKVG